MSRKDKSSSRAPLDFETAAVAVLKRNGRPLSVRQIVDEMIRLEMVEARGQTPQNSMQNTIRRANEKRRATGQPPLFICKKEGSRSFYSLRGN